MLDDGLLKQSSVERLKSHADGPQSRRNGLMCSACFVQLGQLFEASVQAELADDEQAGGNVHMRPLMSVAQGLEDAFVDPSVPLARQTRRPSSRMACNCMLLLRRCFVRVSTAEGPAFKFAALRC